MKEQYALRLTIIDNEIEQNIKSQNEMIKNYDKELIDSKYRHTILLGRKLEVEYLIAQEEKKDIIIGTSI